VHDLNGGIPPSGLFWTVDLSRSAVDFKLGKGRAVLHVKDLCVIDTFQFGGANATPAVVDLKVAWEATGPAVARGKGTTVPPTDPAAFLGEIATAVSTISCSAEEIGFEFESNRGASSSPRGYAQLGTERNGVFLT
jgi:hypothetical protein